MKIVVYSLGCKVNQYESDALICALEKMGHTTSTNLEVADVYILNTCAVTNEAEKKSRQTVAKFKKLNPNAKILICGCASEHNAQQFSKIDGVNYVMGNASKLKIIENLDRDGIDTDKIDVCYDETLTLEKSTQCRAYIKIQDGCNNFCSYCLIPFVRGRSRSRNIVHILSEFSTLAKTSKEIVLTGIDISDYKIDGELALGNLLIELDKFNIRLRLGSLEVRLVTKEFLEQISQLNNICPHFHLSLQSGCDSVLKRMNRHYSAKEYEFAVKALRRIFKGCAITTDIIVGFPEETEKEFLKTYKFAKKIKFAKIHIFPYSKREGTRAAKMKQVGGEIIKQRVEKLEELDKKLNNNYYKKCKNKALELLIEEKVDDYYVGHTENYLKLFVKGEYQPNDTIKVKVKQKYLDGALCEEV